MVQTSTNFELKQNRTHDQEPLQLLSQQAERKQEGKRRAHCFQNQKTAEETNRK